MIDFEKYSSGYRQDLIDAAKREWPLELDEAAKIISECKGIVWLFGNGGSGSLASHIATDLQLGGVAAQSLTDFAAISTYANDWNWNSAFKLQLNQLVREQDVVVVISTSGLSKNQWNLRKWIGEMPRIITFSGKGKDNPLASQGNVNVVIPSYSTGVIQDLQEAYLHSICYWIMERDLEEEKK